MYKNTRKIFKRGILGVLSTFLIITIFSFTSQAAETGEKKKTGGSETTINPFAGAKYVGSEKCKDCHWEEYYSWKGTLHPKKVQPVDEYTVIGDFVKNNKLTLKVKENVPELAGQEVTTTMFKKDGKFYVNTIGPDKKFHDYEITYVIGITWKQRYMTKFPNGELHVLPVQWNIQTQKWVDYHGLEKQYPGDGKYWSDSGKIWQFDCGTCHVTGLKINYDKAKDTFNSTWVDFGAACEACHGPGSNHVDALSVYFKQGQTTSKPAEYIKAAAETIVNPAKLPWELSAMVCGQCHNRGVSTADVSPYKEGFAKHYEYPYGYLPGNALYFYYIEKPGLWPDGSSKGHHQQYNDWEVSEHAKAKVTCTQCHTMHKNPTKPQQANLIGDKPCKDCHTTAKPTAAHRIHTFGSCLDCHMSRVAKSAVSGVKGAIFGDISSHTFKFISPELSIKAGGVDKQPNSCSSCHYHKDTPLTDLVEWLDAAKKADMPKPFSAHKKEEPKEPVK